MFQMINLSEKRGDMHKINDNVSICLFHCIITDSVELSALSQSVNTGGSSKMWLLFSTHHTTHTGVYTYILLKLIIHCGTTRHIKLWIVIPSCTAVDSESVGLCAPSCR